MPQLYLCRALRDQQRNFAMKTKRKKPKVRKIWLGVGAFVVAGASAPGAAGPLAGGPKSA